MTQVDFYVLKPDSAGDRFTLACRLSEKIWSKGRRVLICTTNEAEARHMDRLLWTYQEQNFIPHGLLGKVDEKQNPILIGSMAEAGEEHDVLINLSSEIPQYFSRFDRVAECVDHDQALREASRTRFRYYRERGYPLNTHDI